jgi:PAS domain S-box-containing protein
VRQAPDKPAAEELHQTEERLQAVIESAPVGILEVNLDSHVIRWNPAAERIFGWTSQEVLGRPPPMIPSSKQDEFEDVLATVRAGRAYPRIETYRLRKDGSLVDVEVSAAPVKDSRGRVTSHMVVFTDITERKGQERELRASRARIVDAADTERRRLERNLHDGAQQRLVAASLLLRLAATRVEEDPAGTRTALEHIFDELGLALAELREIARGLHPAVLAGGGLEMALEALAARAPVPATIAEVPHERLPEPVEVAAYYVVAEALTNVAKYARATRAQIQVTRRDGSAVVEVADDGIGGADPAKGTGLRGLADRFEALGGRLDVHSRRGDGTVLVATIPCRDPVEEAATARGPRRRTEDILAVVTGPRPAPSDGSPLRVVVADDSLLLRTGVVHVLERAGFDIVAQAGNADDLVRAVGEHRPDLVVTDIRMPPTYTDEGLRAAGRIRAEQPGTAVLVLSQHAEERYARAPFGERPGGTGYLLKDRVAEPDAFVDAVRRIAHGGSALDGEVVAAMLRDRGADSPLDRLTEGERDLFARIAEGRSEASIADGLERPEPAVREQAASVFERLGLRPADDDPRSVLAVRALLLA